MKKIVTISRSFGSGGHDIGALVAKKLGIELYDKEILTIAAKDSGIDIEHFEAADEKPTNSFLYSIAMSGQIYSNPNDFLTNDRLFAYQSNAILKAAKEKDSLFIGRCADYILRDEPGAIHIFIHADMEHRIKRIMEVNGISESEAKSRLKRLIRDVQAIITSILKASGERFPTMIFPSIPQFSVLKEPLILSVIL